MSNLFEDKKVVNHKEDMKMEYYMEFCNGFKTQKGKEILEEFRKSSCIREYMTNIVFEKMIEDIDICNAVLSFDNYTSADPKNAYHIRALKYRMNLVLELLEKLYSSEFVELVNG